MNRFFLTAIVAVTLLSQTGLCLAGEPKVVENGSKLELYAEDGSVPFAVLDRTKNPDVVLTIEKVGNGFVGIRVTPTTKSGRLERVFVPEIVLNSGYDATKMKVLSTAELTDATNSVASHMYVAVACSKSNKGVVCGWVSSDKASGIIKTAYQKENNGAIVIQPQLDYFLNLEKPIESGELLVIGVFDDCRLGLEFYGDQIAKYYDIHLPVQPVGYLTWYDNRYSGAGTEKSTAEFTEVAERLLVPWGFTFYQIDDMWQDGTANNGPRKNFLRHRADGPYPSGMKKTAETITSHKLVAGIWLLAGNGNDKDPWFADKIDLFVKRQDGQPYNSMWAGTAYDFTNPKARQYAYDQIHQITHDWGYKFLKLDGLYSPMAVQNIYVDDAYHPNDHYGQNKFMDETKSPMEVYRSALTLYRDAAGKDCFFLGCCIAQNMRSMGGSFGLVDAMRVGPDNGGPHGFNEGPLRGSARYFLNGRVWFNDPDSVYVRDGIDLNQAQQCTTWTAISSQFYLFGDWLPDLSAQRVNILRRTMTPHCHYDAVRPLDLFENRIANIWKLDVQPYTIVGLFNWNNDKPLEIKKSFEYMGLDPKAKYVAFDFWNNTFIPVTQNELNVTLPPGTCCAMSIRKWESKPIVVGTNRHVCSPIIELENETYDDQKNQLSGTSTVVANDPYELRIVVPQNVKAVNVTTDKNLATAIEQQGQTLRVRFCSPVSEKVHWIVQFESGTAQKVNADIEGLTASVRGFNVVLNWNPVENYGFVVTRTDSKGNQVTFTGTGMQFCDMTAPRGEKCVYAVSSRLWESVSDKKETVTVDVPEKLTLPELPPKPKVSISTLPMIKGESGWGKPMINRSCVDEELNFCGQKYTDGVGVHAHSNLVYAIPKGMSRFVAVVGLDENRLADKPHKVVVRIWGDVCQMGESEQLLDEIELDSAQKDSFSQWRFNVPLSNRFQQLRLEVTDGGDDITCDHVDWVNAGFVK